MSSLDLSLAFTLDQYQFDALTRLDFWILVQRVYAELEITPFENNFHVELVASRIDEVRTKGGVRMAIALPPRSLKSIIISVALPAWLLGHNPTAKIICVSYGQDLADELAGRCRRIMQSPWYQSLFPGTRLARDRLDRLETTAGGVRMATSVGGVLTGFGAETIIVDDPIKPDEAFSDTERKNVNNWARNTLFTRLNDKRKGNLILVMQRLHEDDLIGHLLNENAGFELLSFPAIAAEDEHHLVKTPFGDLNYRRREGEALHPEREPLDVLEQQRRLLGSTHFAAQYLQTPAPPGGGIVKTEWFRRYDPAQLPEFDYIVQSWDTASKVNQLSDYSVCTTWGIVGFTPRERRLYLIDVFRQRLEYPALKRAVIELARKFGATNTLIEDTVSGIPLLQELKYQNLYIEAVKPKGDKVMRCQAQTPAIEEGRVYLPHNAPWLSAYLHELEMFPNGKYDDQVDSTSQALQRMSTPQPNEGLWEYMRDEAEFIEVQQARRNLYENVGGVPTIRVNHREKGSHIYLLNGRMCPREEDGYFLITEAEFTPEFEMTGGYLVEE